jgi:phospholipid/cholesterol/gamma-HCH transport system substrate-binding protein
MRTKILKLVAFAAVTLWLTYFIGQKIIGLSSGLGQHYTATFDDVTGLYSGNPVNLAGIQIGKVTHVGLNRAGHATISIAVKSGVKLPVDSQIAVRWRNLIGQRFVSLIPGKSSDMLHSGAHLTNTVDVVDLGAFINKLGPLLGQISPSELNSIFTSLAQAFEGNQGNISSLVANLTSVVTTLAERSGTVAQLLTDYNTLTGALSSRDKQIQTMVDNLVLITKAFADNTRLVTNATDQLATLSTGLDKLLTSSGGHLVSVVNSLSVLTGVLHERVTDLEDTLHNLPTAVQTLAAAAGAGPYVLIAVGCYDVHPVCTGVPFPPESGGALAPVALNSPTAFRQLLVGS